MIFNCRPLTLKSWHFEASEDIMTKFRLQALHIQRIKYWNAGGSGSPPSFNPALLNIVILLHKQATRTKHFEPECINKMIIWKNFERNFARNCVKNGFFLQNNSVENSLICPKNKSASHCPTELLPIYPNNHWTIRRRYDHIVIPSSNRIKLKIDWF